MTSLPNHTITPSDFSLDPPAHLKRVHSEGTWPSSSLDNCLSIFYVPDTNLNYSLNPSILINTAGFLYHLNHCCSPCPPFENFKSSLIYCSNVTAAASQEKPHLFRVVTCVEQPSGGLLAQATIMENEHINLKDDLIVVVVERGCLACACSMGMKIQDEMRQRNQEPSRIIILD